MKIYTTAYPAQLPAEMLQMLLKQLPESISTKVERYRRWQDGYGSLFGKLLLQKGLEAFGYPGELDDLRFSAYGRPYLPDGPQFSISHSGSRAICALSIHGRIGVDLEEIRDFPVDEFKNQFSSREWSHILTAPVPLDLFYHYWTAKESIVKADGRGLNIALSSVEVTDKVVHLNNTNWSLHAIGSFPDYACHIASEDGECDMEIQELLPGELLRKP